MYFSKKIPNPFFTIQLELIRSQKFPFISLYESIFLSVTPNLLEGINLVVAGLSDV